MDERTLARLHGPHAVFRRMVSMAGVKPDRSADPYYDEMYVRVHEDRIETPAGSVDSSLATYGTVSTDVLPGSEVAHDGPVTAIFDIRETLQWLGWVATDPTDDLTVEFVGDPETGNASDLQVTNGRVTAHIDCYRDPELFEQITMELPRRFTADERFRLEDGSLAPTVVETTAESMQRIAAGVELDSHLSSYPFVVEDGELRLVLENRQYTRAAGTLEATVEGPDVANEYDEAFAALFDAVSGDLTVQTGPGEPLVVVQERPAFTLRYAVMPKVW
ncbi:hypothetical protein [Haloarchaeobius amylolyticus]|uniref:hypothetical protein n=1 Tax=Haloarchaeobius amylolyticus TaxID=1198296 RepID=UPI00226F73A6|nr:hypothetical protein [Haloarchaeobius amylolyticus]